VPPFHVLPPFAAPPHPLYPPCSLFHDLIFAPPFNKSLVFLKNDLFSFLSLAPLFFFPKAPPTTPTKLSNKTCPPPVPLVTTSTLLVPLPDHANLLRCCFFPQRRFLAVSSHRQFYGTPPTYHRVFFFSSNFPLRIPHHPRFINFPFFSPSTNWVFHRVAAPFLHAPLLGSPPAILPTPPPPNAPCTVLHFVKVLMVPRTASLSNFAPPGALVFSHPQSHF